MAGRGSGIGMGMGGTALGLTSTRSAAPGQVYGPASAGAKGQVHHYLWILVVLEIAALFALRRAFKNYHGG